jgi:hypothetical protein
MKWGIKYITTFKFNIDNITAKINNINDIFLKFLVYMLLYNKIPLTIINPANHHDNIFPNLHTLELALSDVPIG